MHSFRDHDVYDTADRSILGYEVGDFPFYNRTLNISYYLQTTDLQQQSFYRVLLLYIPVDV